MVREAVVVARPSGVAAAPVLVAYVSLHEDVPSLDILGLRERLARALPDYMVPHVIERLDTLPLNSNGKVDRRSLPEPTQTGARRFEEPQGEIESSLGAIWCELLGVSRVGRDDHFFELGGHSLMSIQMMARVEAVMHAQLSIKDIFVHPILKQMADVISDGGVKKPLAQALSDIDSFIDSMETT